MADELKCGKCGREFPASIDLTKSWKCACGGLKITPGTTNDVAVCHGYDISVGGIEFISIFQIELRNGKLVENDQLAHLRERGYDVVRMGEQR